MTYSRRYSDLKKLQTFEDRFEYLNLHGAVGIDTFGFDRYLNQQLYRSKEWKRFRQQIILRDNGCDLGIEGREIEKYAYIHHINPITPQDIINHDPKIFDPDNAITTTHKTHNAIHYGTADLLEKLPAERTNNDTTLWRK